MVVHVKLFAVLRDRAGTGAFTLDLPKGATCSDALSAIGERFPSVASLLSRAACAVNQEYVAASMVLEDAQELALIPPVSGG
ncbi:MAG: MoaD/ThiS family protein [Chthoniobacterales bacterium]|nr:MoaD/ThiS family protein [Chthoniobacterales bacterium]